MPLIERNTYVQAMTVKAGKVQYLGSEKWARKLCDENTKALDSVYMACKRNSPGADELYQINPTECIGRLGDLHGLTSGPAYSLREEDHLGKLEIGNMASVSVFDKDFLTCPFDEMHEAQWVATVIDGEDVAKA